LKTNGLDKVQEGNVIRIAPVEKLRQEREALKQAQQAEEELEPLTVRYIRVSYAKASELKALIDSVLSERGSVTYDERTNQLIVKDIRKGIRNVAELVAKLDLRTPQVLLETQIVEASRSLLRELGSQLGFQYLRTPETGNATGYNFPNSVEIGGGNGGYASSFPAAISGTAGSAVNFLFGSSDGTKNLETTISALEQEGRVRIVSRPAVATTNNKQAIIKSVEKIRVKTPSGGSTIQVGSGSNAGAGSGVATETIEVGITLTVTPQASPDYYVLLDVDAKSSTFGSQTVDGIPSEIERSANSTVLVSSGQTFAMGGIYKLTDRDTVDGVPFLKDVPFVGHLFRRTNTRKSDEELIFFITPRIVEGSFDDAAMKIAQ
jgi:type IV pilus assembly protein PilQ